MKTNDEIKKLCKSVDETKEALMILHIDEKDLHVYALGDMVEISAGISTILYDGLNGDADRCPKELAKAIIDGVSHTIGKPSLSAVSIMLALTEAVTKAHESLRNDMREIPDDGNSDEDDSEDDEQEDCENCENNRWCPLPDAIAYRKANHVPSPKKRHGKKNGKDNKKNK